MTLNFVVRISLVQGLTRMFEHTVVVPCDKFSNRPNHLPQPGGALNAGYTAVDALASVANHLGNHGLIYKKDWWWEGMGSGSLDLCFRDQSHTVLLGLAQNTK